MGSRSRAREAGTDDFPLRQAIGVILLVGLVIMMPNVFVGFFHGIVNKAFQGIRNDPSYCVLGCNTVSPQEKQEAVQLKAARAWPTVASCKANAPAKPGSVRPPARTCATARTACAKENSMSDRGRLCTAKGWHTAPKAGSGKTLPPT
jgi:hypothetical protein